VHPVFKEFKPRVELETAKRSKCLRTNNGNKYIDGDCLAFCKQVGIARPFYVPHTPQQNVVVE